MKLFLLCAAALLLPSVARAERINITAASATYWSATDSLEINVWFDSPLVLERDFFMVGGSLPADDPGNKTERFTIRNDLGPNLFDDILNIKHTAYGRDGRREVVTTTPMGTVDYTLTENSITLTFPFEQTGIESPLFRFGAFIDSQGQASAIGRDMFSSIDQRVVYTPEPSSVALAGIGVVAFGLHRLLRARITKRRIPAA